MLGTAAVGGYFYGKSGQTETASLRYGHKNNGYRGSVSWTRNGWTCQNWNEQYPNEHSRTHENYPQDGLGDHNYCRNPDDEEDAWCYTVNGNRWDYCDIPTDYGAPEQYDYRGFQS